MSKYRRIVSAVIGGGTLALTSVVGLGGSAQAATGAEILVPISLSASGTSFLPRTFTAGDCRQVGQNQAPGLSPSYLTVEKSASVPGLYKITWNATLYTVSTISGDAWHAKFVFRSAAGPIVNMFFDSPSMGSGKITYYRESKDLALTQAQANAITFVDWIGDC